MKVWIKNGLIGLGIWLVLVILFFVGANIGENRCLAGGVESLEGRACYTSFQQIVILIIAFAGFLGLLLAGSPVLSSFGPTGILIFFFGTALTFFLWGVVIGFIIKKIRKK